MLGCTPTYLTVSTYLIDFLRNHWKNYFLSWVTMKNWPLWERYNIGGRHLELVVEKDVFPWCGLCHKIIWAALTRPCRLSTLCHSYSEPNRKTQRYKDRKTERRKSRPKNRKKKREKDRKGQGGWVGHHNFWSFVLDDYDLKRSVDLRCLFDHLCYIHLRWSWFVFEIFNVQTNFLLERNHPLSLHPK